MWSYVVVEDLVATENWCVILLESSHGFFSVSDFSIEPFHLVVVSVASYGYMANMLGSRIGKCPKCGGEMEAKSGKWDHNLTVKAGLFGMKRPEMYVCKECGFIEFYLKH